MLFLAATEESGIMTSLFRTILMNICNVIYKLIIYIYELFLAVGNASILNSEQIQVIYSRVGLILGIVMIFRLIFSFVQYMIDPDKISDKETGFGSIIKKFIVVILALALTDWVFIQAFNLQEKILEENVIAKIVLGVDSNEDVAMDEFGVMFSYNLFSFFFYQNPELNSDGEEAATKVGCGPDYFDNTLKNYIATFKDFEIVHKCINEDGTPDGDILWGNKVYYTSFDGIEALLVGGAVLWMLVMYTITLGVRVVKLAFLRIIAPIPILSYLSPKKDTPFQKWIKQCVVTYLDLFIRLAIIYFCMLLISIIFQDGAAINASTHLSANDGLYKWFNIILILGILLFAKKLPEILGEIFPSMGGKGGLDLGLGLKSRTDFVGASVAKKVPGAALGMATSSAVDAAARFKSNKKMGKSTKQALFGAAGGLVLGAGRGLYQGYKGGTPIKGVKNAYAKTREIDDKYDKLIAEGGSMVGVVRSKISNVMGESLGQFYERQIANNEVVISGNKNVKNFAEEVGIVAQMKTSYERAVQSGRYNEAELSDMYDDYKTIRKAVITASMQGKRDAKLSDLVDVSRLKSSLGKGKLGTQLFDGSDDFGYMAQIKNEAVNVTSFAQSRGLELKDQTIGLDGGIITNFDITTGKVTVRFEEIDQQTGQKVVRYEEKDFTADMFNEISANANQEIINIKKPDGDYQAAAAADKFAGNSNSSNK